MYIHADLANAFPQVQLQHLSFVAVPTTAMLIAVKNPVSVNAECKFLAGVLGASLVDCDFLTLSGRQGIAVAHRRAIATKRQVYISHGFMHAFTNLCRSLLDVMKLQECNWKLVQPRAWQDSTALFQSISVSHSCDMVCI